jgi:serine/threonine protein kinase
VREEAVVKVANGSDDKARRAMDVEVRALRTVGRLSAPAVLAHHADANPPYFIMEYLPGPTLAGLLETVRLDDLEAWRMMTRLAGLLSAIHGAGVAHGDFRAQNIIVAPASLYAIDFGCALFGKDKPLQALQTWRRRQADLWWLGAMIVRAGTGRWPYAPDWGKAIEDYHDRKPDLGSLTGTPRKVARDLLSRRVRPRPSARSVYAQLCACNAVPV